MLKIVDKLSSSLDGSLPAERTQPTCFKATAAMIARVWSIHSIGQQPTLKSTHHTSLQHLVSVPDPKPTPARIAFPCVILEVIYAPDEVWGRDYSTSNYQPISLFACKVIKNSRVHLILCINCTWAATMLSPVGFSFQTCTQQVLTTIFNKWLKSTNQSILSLGNHRWLCLYFPLNVGRELSILFHKAKINWVISTTF